MYKFLTITNIIIVGITNDVCCEVTLRRLSFCLLYRLSLPQKGIDVNAELLNGRNPLHYAADFGHTEVLKYLISKGGKVDVSIDQ